MPLTQKQLKQLWGEGGPYSQVNLIRQYRIIDKDPARALFIIEVEINPTTFTMIDKNRGDFAEDHYVLYLLDSAEYIDADQGYVSYPLSKQIMEDKDEQEVEKELGYYKQAISEMHKYIIEKCNLV
jgi:hypothetical protein